MIGKLIGAFAGNQIAKSTRGGVGGQAGAALGFIAPAILRRMSLPMMAVLGAGGYFAKKYMDKQNGSADRETLTPVNSTANTPVPPVVTTDTAGIN